MTPAEWKLFGLKLRVMREEASLSQNQVAAASGVGPKTISSYEVGTRTHTMKLAQFEAICEACGQNPGEVLAHLMFGKTPAATRVPSSKLPRNPRTGRLIYPSAPRVRRETPATVEKPFALGLPDRVLQIDAEIAAMNATGVSVPGGDEGASL